MIKYMIMLKKILWIQMINQVGLKKKFNKLKAVGKNSGKEKVNQNQEKILIII